MSKRKFKVGDKVKFNSEGGMVTAKVIAVKTKTFYRTGKDGTKYKQHATEDHPKYKTKSIKSGYISYHFGEAMRKA